MGGYLENLHQAKQELSLAFTKEEFITLVQVSGEGRGRKCSSKGDNITRAVPSFLYLGGQTSCQRQLRGV